MKEVRFWLTIKDAPFPETKDVEMGMWNGVEEEWKHLRQEFFCNFLPKEMIKKNIKEQIMRAFGNELEKYIDNAF